MTSSSRADWRPPTDRDWTRLRTLLRELRIHLDHNAEMFEEAEKDLRTIGGESWSIGIGRYPDRAAPCREVATWVEDRRLSFREIGSFTVSPAAACHLSWQRVGRVPTY